MIGLSHRNVSVVRSPVSMGNTSEGVTPLQRRTRSGVEARGQFKIRAPERDGQVAGGERKAVKNHPVRETRGGSQT